MKQSVLFWILILYSAALISLGCFGYYKTGSLVSFYTSLGFGIALLLCSIGVRRKQKATTYTTLILTTLLTVVFTYRYTVTQKFVPGMMAAISCAVFLAFAKHVFRRKKIP